MTDLVSSATFSLWQIMDMG